MESAKSYLHNSVPFITDVLQALQDESSGGASSSRPPPLPQQTRVIKGVGERFAELHAAMENCCRNLTPLLGKVMIT
jgi:hypothetical protein